MHVPLFSSAKASSLYLSLILTESAVAAALFELNKDVQVKNKSEVVSIPSLEVTQIAETFDALLEALGEETNRTAEALLGLPVSWVHGTSILSDKKQLLKELCQRLALKSIGFVVTAEAVVAHQRDSKPLVDEIVLYIEPASWSACIISHGEVGKFITMTRSDHVSSDLCELLARLSRDFLPSHLVLSSLELSLEKLREIEQEFIATDFPESMFRQSPSTEVLGPGEVINAVSLAGGMEVANSKGILSKNPALPELSSEEVEVLEEEPFQSDVEMAMLSGSKSRAIRLPKFKYSKRLPLLLIIGVIVLISGAVLGVFLLSRTITADVNVTLLPKELTKNAEFTIDVQVESSNPASKILKGELITQSVSGSKEVPTTGKKSVGEKAKGSVEIFNKTSVVKEFKAGTVIQQNTKVAFVTDADVSVASASSSFDGTINGKGTVRVTAKEIGEEFNIDKGIEMTIAGFDKSAFIARSESALSGGSSKSVQSVAAADQQSAVDAVLADLKNQLRTKFDNTLNESDGMILSENVVVTKKEFSEEIGKESQSVSATVTASGSAVVYKEEERNALLASIFINEVPEESKIQEEKTKIIIEEQKLIKPGIYSLKASVTISYVPSFADDQYLKLLSGKPIEEAHQFLDSQESVGQFSIVFHPPFIGPMFGKLPSDSSRMKLHTTIHQ